MKTKEVTDELVAKRCKSIFTAMMVTGTIEEVCLTKYAAEVKVRFDEAHQWGDEMFQTSWSHGRLCDESGSLQHLEVIDDKYRTIRVEFAKPIREIDKSFVNDYKIWQTVNLKENIDNFESSRFTQIGDRMAIITSEYNMDCVTEWLTKSAFVKTIEPII